MAQTLYKKREGILGLSKNKQQLSWTPSVPPGAPPELTVLVPNITNLQQTPPDKPKVMLKLTAQSQNNIEPVVHTFTFSSAEDARRQADSLRDSLREAIQVAQRVKESEIMEVDGDGAPAALAIASAVKKSEKGSNPWYSDEQLKADSELQKALLRADTTLYNTFMESMRTKPESISNSKFGEQFWTSRLNLLRAYAIEQNQNKGAYNVLATVKTYSEGNTTKMNITQEQIHLIFTQYPLVQRIYDEIVERAADVDGKTKLSDRRFWTRFFQCRLLKQFKGERITDADPKDNLFDKYMNREEQAKLRERTLAAHIPHIIDLEGNEQNHSQRKGNAPDLLMRPTSLDKVPIIRKLNWMSEEIMAQVAPNDVDPSEPIGMDEETFNALALKDLQGDAADSRLILNVKDQSRFFSGKNTSADLDLLASTRTTPAQLLSNLKASLSIPDASTQPPKKRQKNSSLATSLGLNPDSSSSSSEDDSPTAITKKPPPRVSKHSPHFSSRRSLTAASTQLFTLISLQRAQNPSLTHPPGSLLPSSSAPGTTTASTTPLNSSATPLASSTTSLSPGILERISLLQGSTLEFLSYFWKSFLSGDAARAGDTATLAATVANQLGRIEAVAKDAEGERRAEVERRKRMAAERARRLGRKVVGLSEEEVKGGRAEVLGLMGATIRVVERVGGRYAEAVRGQMVAERDGG